MKVPRLLLQKGRHRRVEAGHAWVFSNEIARHEGPEPGPGDLVEIRRIDGTWIGGALYHPSSLIAGRIVDREALPEALDQDFFEDRLATALQRRVQAFGDAATDVATGVRLVHAEADGLPGVVVDRYADVLVLQIACLGLEQRREALLDALEARFSPRGILLRGDSVWRRQEGLPEEVTLLRGELPQDLEILEHGLRWAVDVRSGQKTGMFLDQRDHRLALRPWAAGARVLDLCSYQGGFALNALAGGARSVTAVDVSAPALAATRDNAARNGLDQRLRTRQADVFELVGGEPPAGQGDPEAGAPYDLVILDPPNMTRSRKAVPRARKAYRRLNAAALGWLRPGGVLATASCSHHLFEDTFLQILAQAGGDTGRHLRMLYRGFQPPDHPVLLAMPETRYLKFFLVQAD